MYLLLFGFSKKVDKRASLAPAPADTRDSFQAASKLLVSSLRFDVKKLDRPILYRISGFTYLTIIFLLGFDFASA